ncbi:MAG: hypothetical protein ACFFF9_13840 [Candidatus Thorarchaeota archaeon]
MTLVRTESINLFFETKSVAIYGASAKALAQHGEIKDGGKFNKTVESDK